MDLCISTTTQTHIHVKEFQSPIHPNVSIYLPIFLGIISGWIPKANFHLFLLSHILESLNYKIDILILNLYT